MNDKKLARRRMLQAFTKKDILKAAIRILTTGGMQGLTMDRVAAEAGVAKGTLYLHFKNKKQIYDDAINESMVPLLEELNAVAESDRAPDEKLRELSHCYVTFFTTHQELYRVILYDRQRAHDTPRRYSSSRYRNYVKRIAAIIDEGIASDLFRPLDSNKLAAMFIEANVAVVIQRLLSDTSISIEDDVSLVVELFMHGIRRCST